MPYPGLIREVWKELPGKSISKLKDDPYYPNDPSLIEIIENFDAPFDIDKDYGSRVKGYFVAPETGNYTFYMSGSQSGELWMSSTERQQNLTKLVSMDQPTGHNQWNKYAFLSNLIVIRYCSFWRPNYAVDYLQLKPNWWEVAATINLNWKNSNWCLNWDIPGTSQVKHPVSTRAIHWRSKFTRPGFFTFLPFYQASYLLGTFWTELYFFYAFHS